MDNAMVAEQNNALSLNFIVLKKADFFKQSVKKYLS